MLILFHIFGVNYMYNVFILIIFRHSSTIFSTDKVSPPNWPRYIPGEILLNISTTITPEHLRKTSGIRFWESFNYLNLTEHVPDVCHSESSILVGK